LDPVSKDQTRLGGLKLAEPKAAQGKIHVVTADGKSGKVIALSRATYRLPKGKAEALASFLEQHSKVPVLEVKVEGETLTITTTQEAQKAINEFLPAIQGLSALSKDAPSGQVKLLQDLELDVKDKPVIRLEGAGHGTLKDGQHLEFKLVEPKAVEIRK